MKPVDNNQVSDAITDEATEWFQAMQAADVPASLRRRFDDWLAASPQHAAEYLRLTELWHDLAAVDADVDALLAEAGHQGNVEQLFREPAGERQRRQRWPAVAAAAIAVVAGFLWYALQDETAIRYATERGEQRSFSLADGSVIHLNTRSAIRVQFGGDARRVELIDGEALFDVAHDPARPFTVSDRHLVARALGTQFNVYRRDNATRVTVLVGNVAVTAQAANDAPLITPVPRVELGPGEQAEVRASSGALRKARVDTEQVTAWTARRLVFEEDSLDEAVGEFNRYNQVELILGSDALARQQISGVFNADDPDAFVDVLENLFDIETDTGPDGSLRLTLPDGR